MPAALSVFVCFLDPRMTSLSVLRSSLVAPSPLPASQAVRPQVAGLAGSVGAEDPGRTDDSRSSSPPLEATRLTLSGSSAGASATYTRPGPPSSLWAGISDDAISRLIERNQQSAGSSLAQRWNGLGGALLAHLASGAGDYSQAMVHLDATRPLGAQLEDLHRGATQVSLQLMTRGGQSITLQINAHGGSADQAPGLQVDIRSQGALDSGTRQALQQLAQGLDKALAALGQEKGPQLELDGLLGLDRSQFASLNLEVKLPAGEPQALRGFSLRLGREQDQLALQTEQGQVQMRLERDSPLARADAAQRQAAIAQQLRAVDAAAARGHAVEGVVALFKSAFVQLHGAADAQDSRASSVSGSSISSRTPTLHLSPGLAARVQGLVSGLADFEASFSSDATRLNDLGFITEQSHTEYRLRQSTEALQLRKGDLRVQQTLEMQLQASILQARNSGMLMPAEGNYDITQINDRQTQRTLIEAVAGELVRAARERDDQQLAQWKMLIKHRAVQERSTPERKHSVELLI